MLGTILGARDPILNKIKSSLHGVYLIMEEPANKPFSKIIKDIISGRDRVLKKSQEMWGEMVGGEVGSRG